MTQTGPAANSPVPDAAPGNWVDRLAPPRWRPFLRLARIDRPIGWWLLLLPCWWSSALAAVADRSGFPDPIHLALFWIGAVAMRGAGSTYNDFLDRDLDRQVERTRMRPLPSGQVSPRHAVVFTIVLCLVGLAVLLCFNGFTIMLGFGSMLLVALYPVMKRITSWPQAVLGLAFAWGALMGWAANFGDLSAAPIWLYVAAVLWTMGYDTIYAIQDIDDDAIAGIRSTARLFGDRTRTAVFAFYFGSILALTNALWLADAGLAAYGGLAAFGALLSWQYCLVNPRDGAGALLLFRSNRNAGLVLFAGLALDAVIRAT